MMTEKNESAQPLITIRRYMVIQLIQIVGVNLPMVHFALASFQLLALTDVGYVATQAEVALLVLGSLAFGFCVAAWLMEKKSSIQPWAVFKRVVVQTALWALAFGALKWYQHVVDESENAKVVLSFMLVHATGLMLAIMESARCSRLIDDAFSHANGRDGDPGRM